MRKGYFIAAISAIFFIVIFSQAGCSEEGKAKPKTQQEMVALGKYIVSTSGCDDCHTPKIFTEDRSRFRHHQITFGLSSKMNLSRAIDIYDLGPNKWAANEKMSLAAWVGPWGISFASNLTPDNATGLGTVTEEMFIKTLREGKLKGVGRPLLPPMPWHVYGQKTDEDLKAIYAYLMSIKPINNMVPQPSPPDKVGELLAKK
ncbi:MAG: diheme cytochrome c-553 [Ignavibacteriaceae bacterium]|nr:diheme cytochrome c-553 [Ignavibacteriaceae bacterium]